METKKIEELTLKKTTLLLNIKSFAVNFDYKERHRAILLETTYDRRKNLFVLSNLSYVENWSDLTEDDKEYISNYFKENWSNVE